jgi:hypothetical protein
MMPLVIQMLLHIGILIKDGKDLVKGLEDVVAGHPSLDDAKLILVDVAETLKSGLVSLPGLSGDQLVSVANQIESFLVK